jgi:ribosomal protein S18 acetylase RimI-like enzyme
MNHNLTFKIVKPETKDYDSAVTLAEEILRKPLGLKFSNKELEEEKSHIRIAGFLDGKLCVTAMLVSEEEPHPVFKMQRVAVALEFQNKGIGSELLKFCEDLAREEGRRAIYCHARNNRGKSAVNFYSKNEYVSDGVDFEEEGIPHQLMFKLL